MHYNVDNAEVTDFLASSDIKTSLIPVKEQINSMDSFSSKAAMEAKHYFSALHLTILESSRDYSMTWKKG